MLVAQVEAIELADQRGPGESARPGITHQTLSKELRALVGLGVAVLGYGRIEIAAASALERLGRTG